MDNDFSKVSLGFAEFVAQLMHETFDAILDSQNYQIDKYLGLEKALNTSTREFKKKYLSDDEVSNFINEELGFDMKAKLILNDKQASIVNHILSEQLSSEKVNTKLTNTQFRLISDFLLDKLVNEKKSKIRMFVERPELARLIVDSGEIKAKLNLFVLNENRSEPITGADKLINTEATDEELLRTKDKLAFDVKRLDFSNIQDSGSYSEVKAKEIVDNETGDKIILIDKNSVKTKKIDFNIPSSRIIAKPISSSGSSIYSEVTIKFRSI